MLSCPYCKHTIHSEIATESGLMVCSECLNPVLASTGSNGVSIASLIGFDDIRSQVQSGSVMEGILKMLNKGLDDLPVLPEVPRRVLTMVHDPIASTAEVANVINEDPVLSASVLKLANSAYYGNVAPIRELRVACARIGMRGLAQFAQASAQSNLYISKEIQFREMIHDLWRHSIASAHTAELLAASLSNVTPGEAFFGGLIHDIGKVLLLDMIVNKYPGHKGSLRESPELLQEVFDTFHPLIGLHLSHRWNLPCQYRFTTFYSNTPNHCPVVSWVSLTHVVCLAGHIAEVSGYGGLLSENGDIHTHPSAVYLNLNQETIETIRKKLPGAVDTLLDVLAAP